MGSTHDLSPANVCCLASRTCLCINLEQAWLELSCLGRGVSVNTRLVGHNAQGPKWIGRDSMADQVTAHWQQLHIHALQADRAPDSAWTPMVDSLRAVNFPVDMNARTLLEALQAGRFGSMRPVLRRFAEAVQESSGARRADQISLQVKEAARGVQREWAVASTLRLVGHLEISVPLAGFERIDVRRLLLTFGRIKSVRSVPFAMLIKLDASAVGG
jgi:hypothetical protein